MPVGDPSCTERQKQPDRNDGCRTGLADRSLCDSFRDGAMLREYFRRDQLDCEPNSDRHDDQVVEITDDRHKIRDQVDWGERVGRHEGRNRLCMPRNTRIARREVDRMQVAPCELSPMLQAVDNAQDGSLR